MEKSSKKCPACGLINPNSALACDCGHNFEKATLEKPYYKHKLAGKRPILVWVIVAFFLLSASFTLLSFYLILSGAVPLTPAQQTYFEKLTKVDYGLSIVVGVVNLTGAIALFLLRRLAFYLFSGALALSMLMAPWHMLTKDWLSAAGGPGAAGGLFGWVILLAVCLYAWKLTKVGILR